MITPPVEKRQRRIVSFILLLAVALDKCWLSRVFPDPPGLLDINPMPVFLDIPVDLSCTFGIFAVMGLFALLYAALLLPYHALDDSLAWQAGLSRWWKAVTGLSAIPLCVGTGGFFYFLLHDHLPKHVTNAIESFGLNTDIYTSLPGHELIHLRGSMVMLGCFFIGIHICLRRIGQPVRRSVPDPGALSTPSPDWPEAFTS